MRRHTIVWRFAIAALLISSAAVCALAQSRTVKQKTTNSGDTRQQKEQPENQSPQSPQPQTTQQPAKQNSRASNSTTDGNGNASPTPANGAATTTTTTASAATTAQANAVRYSYEFTQPNFLVRHIIIKHDDEGRGQISFERKDDDTAIVDPIQLSPTALGRIKALWDTLHFMESNASYQSERQMPHLGTMRLGMEQGGRQKVAEFNWTNDTTASALVAEYRRAADQALFVFNITLARENQPLEAPKLMDDLEKLYKRNGLSDPKQLVPLLIELSTDERIPLIARNHALRLLNNFRK